MFCDQYRTTFILISSHIARISSATNVLDDEVSIHTWISHWHSFQSFETKSDIWVIHSFSLDPALTDEERTVKTSHLTVLIQEEERKRESYRVSSFPPWDQMTMFHHRWKIFDDAITGYHSSLNWWKPTLKKVFSFLLWRRWEVDWISSSLQSILHALRVF